MRLNLVVEGPTEERFVKQVLAAHLGGMGIDTRVCVVATSKDRRHRGGGKTYRHLRYDLTKWMREDHGEGARFSTMFDLYGLPQYFPGREAASREADVYARVELLEQALAQDISDQRLIPHLLFWFSVKMTAVGREQRTTTLGSVHPWGPIAAVMVPECSGTSRVKLAARAGFAALDAPSALRYA